MRSFTAISLFILILFSFMQNWALLLACALALYSIRYSTLVFLPTALLLDGYYGNYYVFPYLTFAALVWYLMTEYLRPKVVSVYAEE